MILHIHKIICYAWSCFQIQYMEVTSIPFPDYQSDLIGIWPPISLACQAMCWIPCPFLIQIQTNVFSDALSLVYLLMLSSQSAMSLSHLIRNNRRSSWIFLLGLSSGWKSKSIEISGAPRIELRFWISQIWYYAVYILRYKVCSDGILICVCVCFLGLRTSRHAQIMRRCGLEHIYYSIPVPTLDSGESIPRLWMPNPHSFKPDETK